MEDDIRLLSIVIDELYSNGYTFEEVIAMINATAI